MLGKLNKPLSITICISLLLHAVILWPKLTASKVDTEAKVKLMQGSSSVQIQLLTQKKLIKKRVEETPVKEVLESPKKPPLPQKREEIKTIQKKLLTTENQDKSIPLLEQELKDINVKEEMLPTKTVEDKVVDVKSDLAEPMTKKTLEVEQEKTVKEVVEEEFSEIEQEAIHEFISDGSQSKAQIVGQSAPKYPRSARKRGFEGIVVIKFTVKENGYAEAIQVIKSSGYKLLDKAAIKHIKKAQFQPAQENQTNISSELQLEIEFSLKS